MSGMVEMNQGAIDALVKEAYDRGRSEVQGELNAMRAYAESARDAFLPAQERIHRQNLELIDLRAQLATMREVMSMIDNRADATSKEGA